LLQATKVEHLHVLASGPLPPNSSDLLASDRLADIIRELQKNADMVLFDSPPCLLVSDALVLGSRVNGVLLVNEVGRTRSADARRAAEALRGVQAQLVGVVLNRQTMHLGNGYQYYVADGDGSLPQPLAHASPDAAPGSGSPRRREVPRAAKTPTGL
jgi:non-specific protein-tyrosine kinase